MGYICESSGERGRVTAAAGSAHQLNGTWAGCTRRRYYYSFGRSVVADFLRQKRTVLPEWFEVGSKIHTQITFTHQKFTPKKQLGSLHFILFRGSVQNEVQYLELSIYRKLLSWTKCVCIPYVW